MLLLLFVLLAQAPCGRICGQRLRREISLREVKEVICKECQNDRYDLLDEDLDELSFRILISIRTSEGQKSFWKYRDLEEVVKDALFRFILEDTPSSLGNQTPSKKKLIEIELEKFN